MNETLTTLIRTAGFLQWSVLIASALVPLRLNWKSDLGGLPRLHQQLFWTYGDYTVLSIVSLGLLQQRLEAELIPAAFGLGGHGSGVHGGSSVKPIVSPTRGDLTME